MTQLKFPNITLTGASVSVCVFRRDRHPHFSFYWCEQKSCCRPLTLGTKHTTSRKTTYFTFPPKSSADDASHFQETHGFSLWLYFTMRFCPRAFVTLLVTLVFVLQVKADNTFVNKQAFLHSLINDTICITCLHDTQFLMSNILI